MNDLLEKISDFWYDLIVKPYYVLTERLNRMVFWGWHMRDSYDFDAMTIYDLLYLKLERLESCMTKYAHCAWNYEPENDEEKLMKKLRLTKILAKNLSCENRVVVDRLQRTKGIKNLEKDELLEALKSDERIKEKRKRLFFSLLSDNIERWWD